MAKWRNAWRTGRYSNGACAAPVVACRCHRDKLRLEGYLFAECSHCEAGMGESGNVSETPTRNIFLMSKSTRTDEKNAWISIEAYPITLKLYTHTSYYLDGGACINLVHYVLAYSINVVIASSRVSYVIFFFSVLEKTNKSKITFVYLFMRSASSSSSSFLPLLLCPLFMHQRSAKSVCRRSNNNNKFNAHMRTRPQRTSHSQKPCSFLQFPAVALSLRRLSFFVQPNAKRCNQTLEFAWDNTPGHAAICNSYVFIVWFTIRTGETNEQKIPFAATLGHAESSRRKAERAMPEQKMLSFCLKSVRI